MAIHDVFRLLLHQSTCSVVMCVWRQNRGTAGDALSVKIASIRCMCLILSAISIKYWAFRIQERTHDCCRQPQRVQPFSRALTWTDVISHPRVFCGRSPLSPFLITVHSADPRYEHSGDPSHLLLPSARCLQRTCTVCSREAISLEALATTRVGACTGS
jgi:hypothetical protein